jgi:phosphoglycolate phosphatase
MKFDAVLFDLDGTLVNSLKDLAISVNYILKKAGFPTHPVEAYKYFAGDGIDKMLERALPEENRSRQAVLKFKKMFLEYYSVHYADNTLPYNGLNSLINELKAKGIKLAVVTNKAQEMAEKVIYKLYGDSFDCILGLREGVPPKPDPAGILMAMEMLNVTPSRCAFVGDSGMDVAGGVNAGAYPIGVLWGFRKKDELLKYGAKSFASNSNELLSILIS